MTATSLVSASTSTSSSDSAQQTLTSSYNTFLTLLTTQLKHQDPTSPLDTNAFTQQLVQMTGVQQQIQSNTLLQQLVSQSAGGQGVTGAVGLIGKSVTANTGTVTLSNGSASWKYTLGSAAASGVATISNAAGQAVWTGPLTSLSSGVNSFSWNGKDASGRQLPDNEQYTLSITAQNASGNAVAATPQVFGVVTSVAQDATGKTVIGIGKTTIPLSKITSVTAS
jgi:flagellar basal-body rod modification protein FlgD